MEEGEAIGIGGGCWMDERRRVGGMRLSCRGLSPQERGNMPHGQHVIGRSTSRARRVLLCGSILIVGAVW